MCFLHFFFLIFIMRNSDREVSEQSPGVWVFWSFALKSISCCDGGFRSFLQGNLKSFHSTFIPQQEALGAAALVPSARAAMGTEHQQGWLSLAVCTETGRGAWVWGQGWAWDCPVAASASHKRMCELPWVLAGSVHLRAGQNRPHSLKS